MVVDYPGRWVRIRRCDDPRVAEDARYREVVDELLADAAVTEAKMMGMPSLKVGDKMFGGLRQGELIVKIGRERVDELVAGGRASQSVSRICPRQSVFGDRCPATCSESSASAVPSGMRSTGCPTAGRSRRGSGPRGRRAVDRPRATSRSERRRRGSTTRWPRL